MINRLGVEASVLPHDPALTEAQFVTIRRLARNLAGINLGSGKMAMVQARLNKRVRALGLSGYRQYLEHLGNDPDGTETVAMLDALSTNVTYFFRESDHFEFLRNIAFPEWAANGHRDRRLRIWSAGCSSGEEPYSIAMTLRRAMAGDDGWDVRILATDLSARMLRAAREGVYPGSRFREAPPEIIPEHFTYEQHGPQGRYRVNDTLREMVNFARLNLIGPWPMRRRFDMIFCRNVMIYFDKATQARLIARFWGQLAPRGYLVVGHSETLAGLRHAFRYIQPAVYQKAAEGQGEP